MKKLLLLPLLSLVLLSVCSTETKAQEKSAKDTLVVIWSSGDIQVAEKIVFMYVFNAKRAKWFDEVTFIVWGPSAKLLSETESLQERVRSMMDAGIKVEACIACARMYEVDDDLKKMGIDVKGMGVPLSNYLKKGYSVLTF